MIYRSDSDKILVLPGGTVIPVSDSNADEYLSYFSFDPRKSYDPTGYEIFRNDPTYQSGGME